MKDNRYLTEVYSFKFIEKKKKKNLQIIFLILWLKKFNQKRLSKKQQIWIKQA